MNKLLLALDPAIIHLLRRGRRRRLLSDGALALLDVALGAWLLAWAWLMLGGSWQTGFLLVLATISAAYVLGMAMLRTSWLSVARWLDSSLAGRDRMSNCLDFAGRSSPSDFMKAHIKETAGFLKGRAPIVLPPIGLHCFRKGAWLALLLLALVGVYWQPTSLPTGPAMAGQTAPPAVRPALVQELSTLRQQARLAGLQKLSQLIARVEQEIDKPVTLLDEQDLTAATPSERKSDADQNKRIAPDDGQAGFDSAAADATLGQLGLGRAKSAHYRPVGKFDSFADAAYAEVFGELDASLLGDELSGAQLAKLSRLVNRAAAKMSDYSFDVAADAAAAEAAAMRLGGNAFDHALMPLQLRSFSEFLRRYAAHMGERAMGGSHAKGDIDGVDFSKSLPTARDGEKVLRPAGDSLAQDMSLIPASDDQADGEGRQVAAKVSAQSKGKSLASNQGAQAGGSGAGQGGGARANVTPKVLPRAEGGEYLPLRGRLGGGESVVQMIQAHGEKSVPASATETVQYQDVYLEYARSAEAELNSESVPWHMRGYIRDYFRSIRPGAE